MKAGEFVRERKDCNLLKEEGNQKKKKRDRVLKGEDMI